MGRGAADGDFEGGLPRRPTHLIGVDGGDFARPPLLLPRFLLFFGRIVTKGSL